MASTLPAVIELGPLSDRSIALCGFMGVGKSTVGRKLAYRLRRPFIDLDVAIVERLGTSIPELFRQGQESLFRKTEEQLIAEFVKNDPPAVISLGGGAYDCEATRQLLRSEAFVIHLDQSFASLTPALVRLRRGRPLLRGLSNADIKTLYDRRRVNYLLADLTVSIPRAGSTIATREVIKSLKQYIDTL